MAMRSSLRVDEHRKNIDDSRHQFLDNLCGGGLEEETKTRHNETVKKRHCRKISFKVRKTSSVHRKSSISNLHKTTVTATTVAELTSKFNEIIEKNNAPKDEVKIRKFVKRLNSFSIRTNSKTMKNVDLVETNEQIQKEKEKPSIKKKPILDEKFKFQPVKRKNSYKSIPVRIEETIKNGMNKSTEIIDGNHALPLGFVKAEINKKHILDEKFKFQPVKRKNSYKSIPVRIEEAIDNRMKKSTDIIEENNALSSGFVRAAINNFEKKNFQPIFTKRSMVELHKISFTEKSELNTSRRKSCKPDIIISNIVKIDEGVKTIYNDTDKNTEEINVEIVNSDSVNPVNVNERNNLPLKSSKSIRDDNTDVLPSRLSRPEEVTETRVSNSEIFIEESRIFPPKSENEQSEKAILESRVSTSEIFFEKSQVFPAKSEDEKSENTKVEESCYSIVDVINQTFPTLEVKSEEPIAQQHYKPNTSFLWNRNLSKPYEDIQSTKEAVSSHLTSPKSMEILSDPLSCRTLPKNFKGSQQRKDKDYEELDTNDGYEPFETLADYEEVQPKADQPDVKPKTKIPEEDDYELINNETDNIYETLPCTRQDEPLPETPEDKSVTYTKSKEEESASNCYESIYNTDSNSTILNSENNYESIYFRESSDQKEILERGSIVSSDQKTNSLYGASFGSWNDGTIYNSSAASDMSYSDKSEWIDISENEYDGGSKILIIKEAVKNKKNASWSEQYRQQWTKNSKLTSANEAADSDSDHHYETLRNSENEEPEVCYDSFASDTDSDDSFENLENEENNGDLPLPAAPNSNDVLTRLAASASKHMRKFTKNLTMTRNDISKSLTRIARRKSKNDVSDMTAENNYINVSDSTPATTPTSETNPLTRTEDENNEKNKNLNRKGFLNKIRRSIIMSPEQANQITSNFKGKSTFYLTPTINIDDEPSEKKMEDDSGISLSPVDRNSRNKLVRPQEPPPPAPLTSLSEDLKKAFKDKRTTSWYAEVDLCKNLDIKSQKEKRPNTCWYDEIGLYQNSNSTPSTSSAENSGTNTNITIRSLSSPAPTDLSREKNSSEKYYNLKNENSYYNESVTSLNSNGTKTDVSFNSLSGDDIQMRLQNEPLYQFYDAAVLDYACHNGISDLDSDNYEDVEKKSHTELRLPPRPSAMELVSSKRNSLAFTKTLWCQIPEVLQSSVLSTLSSHQKKLQEAKFEMVTSEASYLNSLNVLNDHFIKNLKLTLTDSEFDLLFGKIEAVRESSDRLILDLERCWQDNILLHGVCDIIQKHAEEDFSVYIPYCENHTLLDQMMKKLRERTIFADTLKQLEASPVCQSLSLYSFLMLPMQRITRWPLLLDAVLKRLEQHDPEYHTCQYVLATINKIVSQCNEAARNKDREREMLDIQSKMEFGKGVPSIDLAIPNRWLVKSGSVVHMLPKSEEIKLTFGKKFSKTTLYLFLFNDLLIVAKPKSENSYTVLHYCSRNFTELSTSDQLLSLPGKDMTGKYLFFLTLLENQNKKTVEFLLSCSSESDKMRWIEALSPPKSEDPDEVLYECWDCPQVTVVHNYAAVQPDELNLSKGDVINVSRKMADGWYQGERIRDGQTGWFPANYTVEIANPHVRARNLKQRYRLLTFSENYLKNKP